jgi:endonuclease YncB( thermonuclease family)
MQSFSSTVNTLNCWGETIRLIDIDMPESLHSRCEHELTLALAAKGDCASWWTRARSRLSGHGKDRCGRTLAKVLVDGWCDVGDTPLREGKALPYRPG